MNIDCKTNLLTIQTQANIFSCSWWRLLIALSLSALCIALGFWQISRAHEKQRIQAHFTNNPKQPPLSLNQIKDHPSLDYRRVLLKGRFNTAQNLLLDNRFHNHQIGYEVITPFYPQNDHTVILVNRGWVPKAALPPLQTQLSNTLHGLLYFQKGKPFILKDIPIDISQKPIIIESINFDKLSKVLENPVRPFLIMLNPNAKGSFKKNWHPVSFPASRHWSYALQWFAFALIIMFIFAKLHTRRHHEKT